MAQLGTRLIVIYKIVKSALQAAAATLLLLVRAGAIGDPILGVAARLSDHATHAWATLLGEWLRRAARPRVITAVAAFLCVDAALGVVEAWSLRRGYRWGAWLIVLATSALVPVEVLHLAHHPDGAHAGILAINLVVVAYLVLQLRTHHGRRLTEAAAG